MRNLPSVWREFERPSAAFGAWRPLLEQLDSFMNDAWSQQRGESSFAPLCDMTETSDHFVLSFDMPGIDKKDIDIAIQGNTLTVRGERKLERESGSGQSRVIERRYGQFERSVTLPEGVKASQVEATYDNGVLTVAIPKAAEAKPTKVKIGEGKPGFFKSLLGGGDGSKKEKEASNLKSGDGGEKRTESSKKTESENRVSPS